MNYSRLLIPSLLIFVFCSPALAKVRGNFKESQWDRDLKDQREVALGPSISYNNINDMLVKAELSGKELIMLECGESGVHALLTDPVGRRNADNTYHLNLTKDGVLETHSQWSRLGYKLIYLKENDNGRRDSYCAVWIHKKGYDDGVAALAKIGVAPPTIEITGGVPESKPETETKPIEFTSGPRHWTSQKGQSLEATLLGVEGGNAKLKKSNGATFNYPIKDLSAADQTYLRELVKQEKNEAKQAEAAPKMSDWMDSEDFDDRYTDEKVKGNFAAYIEYDRRDRVRALFMKRPKGLGWYYLTKTSRSNFLEYDTTYTNKGLVLATATFEKKNNWHTAVWVAKRSYQQVAATLEKVGVSLAKFENGEINFSEYKD